MKVQDAEDASRRASLIRRVKTASAEHARRPATPGNRVGWQRAHPAFDAWRRPNTNTESGEYRILLAMRYELCGQVGLELPEVDDQTNLTSVGKMFGAIMDDPPVSDRLSKGETRLAVLTYALSDDLLAEGESEVELFDESFGSRVTG